MTHGDEQDPLVESVKLRSARRRRWLRDGEPTVAARLAQIGVLGWIVVVPALAGLFIGRWLDQEAHFQLFFTAPLLIAGLGLGCWSAWKWMNSQ